MSDFLANSCTRLGSTLLLALRETEIEKMPVPEIKVPCYCTHTSIKKRGKKSHDSHLSVPLRLDDDFEPVRVDLLANVLDVVAAEVLDVEPAVEEVLRSQLERGND